MFDDGGLTIEDTKMKLFGMIEISVEELTEIMLKAREILKG